MTFVNAKRDIKECLLSGDQQALELEDPSLYKRLQYAKDVLVQMMGYQALMQERDNLVPQQNSQKMLQQQDECLDNQDGSGQLQPAILSPPKMKSSQSTDGFNQVVNRAAARNINTAGKLNSSQGRSRVYSGRGFEPAPMVSTPAGSAINRSRTGGQAMSNSKLAGANASGGQTNTSITGTSVNRQRK